MAKTDEHPYGDPEQMDRAALLAKLEELQIPVDPTVPDGSLRSALAQAPQLVAEREAREQAAGR